MRKAALILPGLLMTGVVAVASGMSRRPACEITDQASEVQGGSMNELFQSGQRVTVAMGYYACNEVQRGDVVLFHHYANPHPLIKQVQVVPGDRFYLRGYGKGFHLVVNGEVLKTPRGKPYLFPKSAERVLRYYETAFHGTLPEDHFLIFGTQPSGSLDSSWFGPVLKKELLGKVR